MDGAKLHFTIVLLALVLFTSAGAGEEHTDYTGPECSNTAFDAQISKSGSQGYPVVVEGCYKPADRATRLMVTDAQEKLNYEFSKTSVGSNLVNLDMPRTGQYTETRRDGEIQYFRYEINDGKQPEEGKPVRTTIHLMARDGYGSGIAAENLEKEYRDGSILEALCKYESYEEAKQDLGPPSESTVVSILDVQSWDPASFNCLSSDSFVTLNTQVHYSGSGSSSEDSDSVIPDIGLGDIPFIGGDGYKYDKNVDLRVNQVDYTNTPKVKLWGDVDFQSYECYYRIENENSENLPRTIIEKRDSEGTKKFQLNRLGETVLQNAGNAGSVDFLDGEKVMVTQCFKDGQASNSVITETARVEDQATGESLPAFNNRFYTPKGEYTLGYESSGIEDFKQKYRFSNIQTRSCNTQFQGEVSSGHGGSVTVENRNNYPVKVGVRWLVKERMIEANEGWIEPNSRKEFSFSNEEGVPDFPADVGSSTPVNAELIPLWTGSGGGSCKVSCGTLGGSSANTESPSSCTASQERQSQQASAEWIRACPEEINKNTLTGKKNCIINHVSPECVETSSPAPHCSETMPILCSYLGLEYNQQETACEVVE